MSDRVTPLLHVADVRATMEWYQRIGFTVVSCRETNGQLDHVVLRFGDGGVMLAAGGKASSEDRRDIDLYVHGANVDDRFETIKDKVEVKAPPHDTHYGMHELTLRDPNGFWVTFAEPIIQVVTTG